MVLQWHDTYYVSVRDLFEKLKWTIHGLSSQTYTHCLSVSLSFSLIYTFTSLSISLSHLYLFLCLPFFLFSLIHTLWLFLSLSMSLCLFYLSLTHTSSVYHFFNLHPVPCMMGVSHGKSLDSWLVILIFIISIGQRNTCVQGSGLLWCHQVAWFISGVIHIGREYEPCHWTNLFRATLPLSLSRES